MSFPHCSRPVLLVLLTFVALLAPATSADDSGKPLTFTDLMKFHLVKDPGIAKDGSFVAYATEPGRGDGEAVVRSVAGTAEYRIERGSKPRVSANSRWAAATVQQPFEEREKAKGKDKKKDDGPKTGLALVDLTDGTEVRVEEVESWAFSEDGRWLAYRRFHEEEKAEDSEDEGVGEEPNGERKDGEKKDDKKEWGTTLHLRELATGQEIVREHVKEYAFSRAADVLAYTIAAPGHDGNGVYVRALNADNAADETALEQQNGHRYAHLTWVEGREAPSLLGFVAAPLDEDDKPGAATVWYWDGEGEARTAVTPANALEGWTVPAKNTLTWSRDGQRLFFGFKPADPDNDDASADAPAPKGGALQEAGEDEPALDPYDVDALLAKREVDVWHWNDPLIVPNQKKSWDEEKDRTYRAVVHLDSGRIVPLADLEVRHVEPPENPRYALGRADTLHLKKITWDGAYFDLYAIDLASGERQLVTEALSGGRGPMPFTLSPDGRHVAYYQDEHWHLYDVASRKTRNVTADLGAPFADEDWDYPQARGSYGMGGWWRDSSAVLIYDKYDVWSVPSDGGAPQNLTGIGRAEGYQFRVLDLDAEEDSIEPGAALLLTARHERQKHDGLYGLLPSRGERPRLVKLDESGEHRLRFIARAEDARRILFTRESYHEFPDLWTADLGSAVAFENPRRLSDVNPQIADFAWGRAELVEWTSLDGIPLQGALIKPGNYEPGKRYPVLVYYYRFFSQRVREFNEPVINHRPSFPLYASNDYAVFLPDIRFDIGRPGFSATKCLVPGIQKLIDMGVADPDAIGLHGHSWSGYQTAFVITQTNIFKAAVAGAPVSNMTSAYSGIRLGTGLARQFQYERSQSRIGGSLWEYPERYVENSPVFFADRIETPLLIQFGDRDEAVPWQQGIELYLALRRLGKDCVFLQYRDEPHHLKKYANKLDYSIKMKEFFDHHLKGAPAPSWMSEGVPYQGE